MGYVLSMVLQIGWVLKIKIYLRMISLMVLMMNMIMGIERFWQKRSQLMIQLSI